jgi:uncharacterized protein YndB with AHSA1/START domain
MSATRISRHVKAPRARVYSALADADTIVKWRVDGMTSHVYAFEGRGGHFPDLAHVRRADRSRQDERADGYIHGHLFKLVPNERVVEVVEFETADPALRGEMTTTITLADADGGTELVTVQGGLPCLLAHPRKRFAPP